jgi:lipopolysaccharide export system permease protein
LKIIDKYLLKSFLITFTTVFVILFFIFVLQVVWLYIGELAGKDLNLMLVLKFLGFKMPSVVPMVLPLSVLLASIMTYGSLSENYEFAAMKSAGISLQRAMRTLTIFIVLLSIVSFFFANNVIPYAEYKFVNFRRNIAQLSPAMAIAEGQLSEVGNYNIKVEKKSGEKGNLLSGVTIHKKLDNGEGSTTVIKAKTGELISSKDSNILKLVLNDGYYYEDIIPQKFEDRQKLPFAKSTFKKDIIYMDLTKLNKDPNAQQGEISNTSNMLTLSQLKYTIDSLNTNFKKDIISYSENIYQRVGMNSLYKYNTKPTSFDYNNLLNSVSTTQQPEVLRVAKSNVENIGFSIDSTLLDIGNKQKNINGHWIALFEKFMIAFSCILMFFIGAPLGAIIRKGGMGLPIVFAVAIFIVFFFVNSFGKRLAQENGTTPFIGVWLATIILFPLALYLTKTAINDIGGIITFDAIKETFANFFKRFLKNKKQVYVK